MNKQFLYPLPNMQLQEVTLLVGYANHLVPYLHTNHAVFTGYHSSWYPGEEHETPAFEKNLADERAERTSTSVARSIV